MVDEDMYCDDVLNQITSVEAALNGVRKHLLEAHIRSCVVDQIVRGELAVVDELMKTISRMVP
jgi:CsoR family transcriptional regulator, copper-sensing transcriptional repressor